MVQGGHNTPQKPTCLVSAGIQRIEQMAGDTHPSSHGSGVLVLVVILCAISSKIESWGYKKGHSPPPPQIITAFRRRIPRLWVKQGRPAKEGICPSSTLQHHNCQIPLATTSKEGMGPAA